MREGCGKGKREDLKVCDGRITETEGDESREMCGRKVMVLSSTAVLQEASMPRQNNVRLFNALSGINKKKRAMYMKPENSHVYFIAAIQQEF